MDRSQGLRVKSLLFMTPQVLPRSHTQKHTHAHVHAYTYVRLTFSALVAAADLGEFNLGCTNFSLQGQGWRWRLCVNRGQTDKKSERMTKRKSSLF